ncbi:MAG: hypothetical protein COB83_06430 [Gammaproteobacteria bacterium]|nr:MAG: hypothetical protein COB83_06430 [Gammaproteobacteria bacterium]
MNRLFSLIIVSSALCFCQAIQAEQVKKHRFVLVIGNQNYITAPLLNPINDAMDIASRLNEIGFNVTTLTDVKTQQIEPLIESFYQQLTHFNDDKVIALLY